MPIRRLLCYEGNCGIVGPAINVLCDVDEVVSHLDQAINVTNKQTNKQTIWSESASELYRPSDRRLSAKGLPTFADKGCHVVSVMDPSAVFSVF
jgi:hypothetical protein